MSGRSTSEPLIGGSKDTAHRRSRLFTWPLLIGLVVVAGLTLLSLAVGEYNILSADDGWDMFFITRVPRTVALILAGATLAITGLVMQMIAQNRFVEPTTTGTTEWAGLGLITIMIVAPTSSVLVKMVVAIAFAFVGTLVFFAFIQRVTLKSSVIVPILGMMLGAVVGSVTNFLALSTNLTQNLSIWFAGSFTAVLQGQYEPIWILAIVLVVVFAAADRFTLAGLGKDLATNVGLNHRNIVILGTGLIALSAGIITVVVGNLPFLGLVVPNIVSMFRGDDLRSNLPWVALSGVGFVITADLISRTIISPFEVPVSVILGAVGAFVFIGLLLRGRRVAN